MHAKEKIATTQIMRAMKRTVRAMKKRDRGKAKKKVRVNEQCQIEKAASKGKY